MTHPSPAADAATAKVFENLTEAQADGLACVKCGEDFTILLGTTVPVGVSTSGSQVFACRVDCAARAAAVPEHRARMAAAVGRSLDRLDAAIADGETP